MIVEIKKNIQYHLSWHDNDKRAPVMKPDENCFFPKKMNSILVLAKSLKLFLKEKNWFM